MASVNLAAQVVIIAKGARLRLLHEQKRAQLPVAVNLMT
jgi:hypothetical protein